MRELLLYTLAVAYLVLGAASMVLILLLAWLWGQHWFRKYFPNVRAKMLRRKREKLIDKYMRSFDK